MSAQNFFKRPSDARATMLQSYPGTKVSGEVVTALNNAPEAAQVSTVALPVDASVTANAYTVTINGVVCSATTAGGSQDDLGAALVAAIQAQGAVAGLVTPTYAAGTLTLTAVFVGLAFTIAAAGDNIGTVATPTAAAEAEDVGAGLLMVGDGSHTDGVPDVGMVTATSTLADDFIGFSVRSERMTNATTDGDDPVYAAGKGLPLMKTGTLIVEAAIAPGDSLYVGTATDERGLLFNAAGTGRLAVSADDVRCVRAMNDGLAEIRILRTAL